MLIDFLVAAFIAGTPLILATTGEIITEKSGSMNLGVEGTMYIGAVAGLAAAVSIEELGLTGYWAVVGAFIAALLAGMVTSAIFGFMTITLKSNQNVVGLTITILGTGVGNFFGEVMGQKAGGFVSVTEATQHMLSWKPLEFLSNIPSIGNVLFSYTWLVYLAVIIAIGSCLVLYRTRMGLNLKAVGENPAAADAAGVSVTSYRYIAAIAGGGLCGIAGMYMCMITNNGVWVHDCISGYGWLAVALVIFSKWNPLKAIPCSVIFGALMIMRFYIPIPGLSPYIYDMFPYVMTSIVIVLSGILKNKAVSAPGGCGENYFREAR